MTVKETETENAEDDGALLVFSLSLWKFVFSVSEPEKFLPQLPYNERSQCNQGLALSSFKQPLTQKLA